MQSFLIVHTTHDSPKSPFGVFTGEFCLSLYSIEEFIQIDDLKCFLSLFVGLSIESVFILAFKFLILINLNC